VYKRQKIDKLGALQYTIVAIAIDVSGSVARFADKLRDCLISIIGACKANQRAEFLVIRVTTFSTHHQEVHGYVELKDIDENDYPEFRAMGFTCLFDATYDAIGSTLAYSEQMVALGYDVNGAVYIITDGGENPGGGHITIASPKMIKDKIEDALRKEDIESLITTVVALHDPNDSYSDETEKDLKLLVEEAGMTKMINIGEATDASLAKLADWVSSSVSSQSDQVGSNAPSQVPDF